MSNQLNNSRNVQSHNVIHCYNREILRTAVDFLLQPEQVIPGSKQFVSWRGRLSAIRYDNGTEHIRAVLQNKTSRRDIRIESIQFGNPLLNGYVAQLNRIVRDECLGQYPSG